MALGVASVKGEKWRSSEAELYGMLYLCMEFNAVSFRHLFLMRASIIFTSIVIIVLS